MLTYCVADPAGNRTVLVTSPVEKNTYAEISRKLMARIDGCEQVGFLTKPIYGGDVRLEMMGGEFCGNALRCAAYYYVRKNISQKRSLVATEISGCERILEVSADVSKGESQAEMMLPRATETVDQWGGSGAMAFLYDGIVHIVRIGSAQHLPEESLKAWLQSMSIRYNSSAVGLMQVDLRTNCLVPVVYVRDTNTMVYESSCASGSAAAAVYLALHDKDGVYSYDFQEPGGILNAIVVKREQKILSVKIGGALDMGEEQQIEIE
ncbi:MAG: hypothetical protein ACI3W6_08520 [Clostridia bacterium]